MDGAERRFANLGPLGTDIKVVKNQIGELKNFKSDIDPQMVKVEALNRYNIYIMYLLSKYNYNYILFSTAYNGFLFVL